MVCSVVVPLVVLAQPFIELVIQSRSQIFKEAAQGSVLLF